MIQAVILTVISAKDFRGRELSRIDLGKDVMDRVIQELAEIYRNTQQYIKIYRTIYIKV